MDTINKLIMWSDGISLTAAKYLRNHEDKDRNQLRLLINEWTRDIEPCINSTEKKMHTIFDYQFYYLESRDWDWCDNDEWRDPQTNEKYLTNDAVKLQCQRDYKDKLPHPGISKMEAIR